MSDFVAHTGPLVTPAASRADAAGSTVLQTLRAYVRLTKPRVIELLLVTTVPAMVLAERGVPSPGLLVTVLVGGTLAAGGANTINCFIERERDGRMRRTRDRPLPTGTIEPRRALAFGIALELVALTLLGTAANLLAAALTAGAMLFYVFVYTIWLKPRTPQNIVIGGAAGAVPVLVGWAAVTGRVATPAWVLFVLVFLWTPPHFWALAMRFRDDYAAAEIPMLPVVRGAEATTREIFRYAVAVVATSLALRAASPVGPFYLVAASVLGSILVWRATALRRDPTSRRAIAFFNLSNLYLAVLFASLAIDTLIEH